MMEEVVHCSRQVGDATSVYWQTQFDVPLLRVPRKRNGFGSEDREAARTDQ
jgi:hypothetical protein